ncbi:MAG: NnrS family protein, partial [Bdellovibrionales bacterium]|nr:NnrS family protein [Bdellovibrionales bacterium]
LWAFVLIFIWVLVQANLLHWTFALNSITWHAHEMLFGFTSAIVAGFILTASQNWAGKPGVSGKPLQILTGLWLLARVLSLFSQAKLLFTVVDLLFFPYLMYLLIPYLGIASQKRNHIFFILFSILFVSNLFVHLEVWDITQTTARPAYLVATHTIIVMIILLGGRVIPFFTERAISASKPIKINWIEILVIPSSILFIIFEATIPNHFLTGLYCFFLALLHFLRWFFWGPQKVIKIPLLWILYVGYLWVPIGFLLYGLVAWGHLMPSLATHALASGAIGIMIYAMVSRVTLGHTGRALVADRWMVLGYILISAVPLIRVILVSFKPDVMSKAITSSGVLWCLAYLIIFVRICPMLLHIRPDGKMG